MRISDRVKNMKYSAVRKLAPLASEAEKKGIKVYRLNIGQPNIETPKLFFEGLKKYTRSCYKICRFKRNICFIRTSYRSLCKRWSFSKKRRYNCYRRWK